MMNSACGGVCRVFEMGCALGAIFLLVYKYCGRFAPAVPPAVLSCFALSLASLVGWLSILPVSPVSGALGSSPLPWFPLRRWFFRVCCASSAFESRRCFPGVSLRVLSLRRSLWWVVPAGFAVVLFFARLLAAVCGCSGCRVCGWCLWFCRRFPSLVVWLLRRCPRLPSSVSRFFFLLWLCCWGLLPCRCLWSLGSPAGCVSAFIRFCVVFSAAASFWRVSSILPLPCACSFRSPRRLRVGCGDGGVVSRVLVAFVLNFWLPGDAFVGVPFAFRVPVWLRCFVCWMWGACRAFWRRAGCFFLLFGKKIVAASRPLCLRRFFCVCLALALP